MSTLTAAVPVIKPVGTGSAPAAGATGAGPALGGNATGPAGKPVAVERDVARGLMAWPVAALLVIAAGWAVGGQATTTVWMIGLSVCAVPIVVTTVADARHGHLATDIVAVLAILAALALVDPLPGLVVVIMRQGGLALEVYAQGRASRAVRELEAAAPRRAHRLTAAQLFVDVDVAAVEAGDVLLVRPGELVPCDGVVLHGTSDVDASALTGEPAPIGAAPGTALMSGSLNGSGVLWMRATARAAESQYARIVELVRTAQSHKAPLQRMADRYAVWFTPFTLAVCGIAFVATGDWTRVLAILVVATPCPLILAAPVAFVGGINRAARQHVVIRNGGALEVLSRVSVMVLDKTGTLTLAEPRLARVRTAGGADPDMVLGLAASVEVGSSHRLARSIVRAAGERGIAPSPADGQTESPGHGVTARVDGRLVRLGARSYVMDDAEASAEELGQVESADPQLRTYVAIDGRVIATLEFVEQLRGDAAMLLGQARAAGVRHVALLTGDRQLHAQRLAAQAGIDDVRGDLLPGQKAEVVAAYRNAGEVVMMVGDGTNDAPALAAADVGVALAGHGGGVTTEAADVIVLRDSLAAVAEAMRIGRDTTRIARQSIAVGLGLSALAMIVAAFGGIAPVTGALLQEGIDLAVIVNALRTSQAPRSRLQGPC